MKYLTNERNVTEAVTYQKLFGLIFVQAQQKSVLLLSTVDFYYTHNLLMHFLPFY